jgi:dolichol-phosphate mannosyltransferase
LDKDLKRPDFSIVMPVYCNEGSLEATVDSLLQEVFEANPQLTGEIVFVDDGSVDGSVDVLTELQRRLPNRIAVLLLTRNFGQPNARLAGLHYARGRCVISISADGQEPAGLVAQMLKVHTEEQADVVICARKDRDESYYRKLSSKVFFLLMQKLAFPEMPAGGFSGVLLSRRALGVVLQNQDANPFFQGQILWTGFPHKIIHYHRPSRSSGESKWSIGRKITLLVDAVVNYSFFPIRFISSLGILGAAVGFIAAVLIIIRRIVVGTAVPGWATVIALVLFLGGLQILMLGVIGEYIWRTLAQVRRRNSYVVKQILDETPHSSEDVKILSQDSVSAKVDQP